MLSLTKSFFYSMTSYNFTCISLFSVTLVHNKQGKQLAIYNGYTFYNNSRPTTTTSRRNHRWRCMKTPKCNARILISRDGTIVKAPTMHNHPHPLFKIHNGIYYKLWEQVKEDYRRDYQQADRMWLLESCCERHNIKYIRKLNAIMRVSYDDFIYSDLCV